ncbi:MAG: resuscitation-promoting factor RpfB [Solirubrobacteraceae bacterium]|nr:resuscitation-promoting factor RpfB [Solirubrobacteraceae bacterium]
MGPDRDLSSPIPWRRAQRASDARRVADARRRRLALRGRAGLTLAVAASTVAAGGALAQAPAPAPAPPAAAGAPKPSAPAGSLAAVQRALGITADGVHGPRTRAAIRRFQRRNGLKVDGVAGPQTRAALGLAGGAAPAPAVPPAAVAAVPRTAGSSTDPGATLARIAACESGGDPTAVSADGRYRGKYQFTRETWSRLGGSGDPAQADEAEQDRLAAMLLAQSGTTPWPTCGA